MKILEEDNFIPPTLVYADGTMEWYKNGKLDVMVTASGGTWHYRNGVPVQLKNGRLVPRLKLC